MSHQPTWAHCPFCGGYNLDVERRSRCVVCQQCGAEGPQGQTRDEAIRRWNDRAGSSGARGTTVAIARRLID